MPLLTECCKIIRVENATAAGQTEIVTDVLDMAEWDGVVFIAALGDVTASSVITLTLKENTANSTSSPTPTAVTSGATTATTAGASNMDNKLLVVDVLKNKLTKRYVFGSLTRTAQDAVVDDIIAVQYRGRAPTTTQSTTIFEAIQSAS